MQKNADINEKKNFFHKIRLCERYLFIKEKGSRFCGATDNMLEKFGAVLMSCKSLAPE